jgi:hypothetical protein
MARKQKRYHYIYKTTNTINGKYYIGMHSTDDLTDGYIGSGKRLWYSIKKYGKENFKVEILEFFLDRVSLKNREIELVNEQKINDPLCMNIVYGGGGGFISPEGCKKGGKYSGNLLANRIKTDSEYREKHKQQFLSMTTELRKKGLLQPPNWMGKKHKEETKQKIGEANSLKQKGEGNSQFGTCWITDGNKNKKIKKTDKLPKNWGYGRK